MPTTSTAGPPLSAAPRTTQHAVDPRGLRFAAVVTACLLYTSDAADE